MASDLVALLVGLNIARLVGLTANGGAVAVAAPEALAEPLAWVLDESVLLPVHEAEARCAVVVFGDGDGVGVLLDVALVVLREGREGVQLFGVVYGCII